ncbi:Gldg family protein [Rhodoligotrophos defluvii]|uniref:Gldg family protein n=1 Tax=Rhodoligotrophos defluvii TaxID=2561934 RepID=UPI0010C9CF09|nr:Gldg family protein [Rhodoligotrophos defluvii]
MSSASPNSPSRRLLAAAAIVLAFLTLLGVNLFASQELPLTRLDVTEDKLYTISESTRAEMAGLREPIMVRLFFSKRLGEVAPTFQAYFDRVRALLDYYATLSNGRLTLEIVDPEPFTDAEDEAVAAGLQGVPLGNDQLGYFGLVATNRTDDRETIPFFAFDRERFLEYDLTRLIHKLATAKRPKIGLITTVPIMQSMNPMTGQQQPAWRVIDQIRDYFDLEAIDSSASTIPADVDLLMLVQPAGLAPELLLAIDQFALAGKPVLAFVDPLVEIMGPTASGFGPDDGFLALLSKWGARFKPDEVAGDADHARQVQYGSPSRPSVADYLVWLDMTAETFAASDPVFAGIKSVTFATPGILHKADNATITTAPLIETSDNAMAFPLSAVRNPDPKRLLDDFAPGGLPLALIMRVNGKADTAYPNGVPKGRDEDAEAAEATETTPASMTAPPLISGTVNAIIIADVDMLYDSFWADVRELLGTQFLVPLAGNADMVINALQYLAGGTALADLRGRGVQDRPFTLVQAIRREAEARFRARAEALNQNLQQVEARISSLQQGAGGGNVILSDEDRRALAASRAELVSLRQQLRDVQRALREDIDRLDLLLKLLNMALVPVLIGIAGGIVFWVRRQRRVAWRNASETAAPAGQGVSA